MISKNGDAIMISYDLLIYNAGALLISGVNTCTLCLSMCM